jgi:hypothetical protein
MYMKKIILKYNWAAPVVVLMSMVLSSCLKDNGFEDGEYQLVTGPGTEGSKYVSIPLATRRPNTLGLESKAGFQPVELFKASYDYKDAAETDIAVVMERNDALVTAIDPTVELIPASEIQIPSLTLNIAKGKWISDEFFKIDLNTGTLDPNKKYGIGFSVASVSMPGVAIPSNLKNVVFVFTLKNKYDGIYSARVRMAHPSDRSPDWLRTPYTYPYEIHLVTTGPNSVEWVNTAFGTEGYHPLMTPGVSGFGATRPAHTFDANDNLVSTVNAFPNPANGRAFINNPAVTDSRFDPATKTVYAAFIMTQPGFQDMPIFDTLTFLRARP